MDTVIRSAVIYLFLLLVLRIAGKRTIAHITTFDFVLLLVIGEATQQALIGPDHSLTTSAVAICTMMFLEVVLSALKGRSVKFSHVLESQPIVIAEHGQLLEERAHKFHVDENDVLEAAREQQGLERLDQVAYAVLERSGTISIIPKRGD